ncbi:MAG: PAS domain-containing protein [Chloroflexi bacterium]|uniref:PAS domain-containing protein n=1 Tax=Candidatus Chlorohelix allophototropha TaxID=3003348 RepID=A0A8T7M7R9_9CHLR|nr:PAS domain-containing protein [Chloroflexota bacterium]WJW69897.1 PAS domain-containing protein [Chloroflexota bacterium L227-S17]
MFQFTPYLLPFIFSAVSIFIVALLIWRLRHNVTVKLMLAFIACLELWIIGFIFEIAATTLDAKITLANLQFIGIDLLPIVWVGLILSYLGYFEKVRRFFIPMILYPVISQFVIWTDPLHHLFRKQPLLDITTTSIPILQNNYGIWYYFVQMPLLYIFSFSIIGLLVNTLLSASGPYRSQIIFLLISALIPLVINVFYVFGISPIPNLNLSAVGLSFTTMLIVVSYYRYQFLDLLPVARSMLVDVLQDAWIVLDRLGRIVDLNQTAQEIVKQPKQKLLGQGADTALQNTPELLNYLLAKTDKRGELQLSKNDQTNYYDVNVTIIRSKGTATNGSLVVMRDISQRVQIEHEREHLIAELREALEQIKLLSGLLPICASCKNIRDDQGYWHQVETYLEDNSDMRFSHGICPNCMQKLYPDLVDLVYKDMKDERSLKELEN